VDYSDFIKGGVGAVIGFLLAQFVAFGTLIWNWFRKSKLAIEKLDRNMIMSHTIQISREDYGQEEVYGFTVRNKGKKIATGVRFQILGIQFREKHLVDFSILSDLALNLKTYAANPDHGQEIITLVPKAAATVALALLQAEDGVVYPSAKGVMEYYEEMCADAFEYRFEIAVFDDSGDFATETLTIIPKHP
jgi:hypothetical protein